MHNTGHEGHGEPGTDTPWFTCFWIIPGIQPDGILEQYIERKVWSGKYPCIKYAT